MTDLLSLLCEAAGDFDDLEDPRVAKKPKTLKSTLASVSGSPSLGSLDSPRSRRASGQGVNSSSPFSRSPQHTSLNFGFEDRNGATEPVSPATSFKSNVATQGGVETESSLGASVLSGPWSSNRQSRRPSATSAANGGVVSMDVSAGKADAWCDGGVWSGEENGEAVGDGERNDSHGVCSEDSGMGSGKLTQHHSSKRSRSQQFQGDSQSMQSAKAGSKFGSLSTPSSTSALLPASSSSPSTSNRVPVSGSGANALLSHHHHHHHQNGGVVIQVGNSIVGIVNNTNGVASHSATSYPASWQMMEMGDSSSLSLNDPHRDPTSSSPYHSDGNQDSPRGRVRGMSSSSFTPGGVSTGGGFLLQNGGIVSPSSASSVSSSAPSPSSFLSSYSASSPGFGQGPSPSSPQTSTSPTSPSSLILNCKKRKRVTKQSSRRAKPLTVDILFQIFDKMGIFHIDAHCGTYKLVLPTLKSAECSSIYFAVTEWQCFRKRIMNHGFEIVDEQPSSWIRVRPNLVTHDGVLIFEDEELRHKYATPCKIKSARERNEILEIGPMDPSMLPTTSSPLDSLVDSASSASSPGADAMSDMEGVMMEGEKGDRISSSSSSSTSPFVGSIHAEDEEVFGEMMDGFMNTTDGQSSSASAQTILAGSGGGGGGAYRSQRHQNHHFHPQQSPQQMGHHHGHGNAPSSSSPLMTMMMADIMMTEDSNGSSSSSSVISSADEADDCVNSDGVGSTLSSSLKSKFASLGSSGVAYGGNSGTTSFGSNIGGGSGGVVLGGVGSGSSNNNNSVTQPLSSASNYASPSSPPPPPLSSSPSHTPSHLIAGRRRSTSHRKQIPSAPNAATGTNNNEHHHHHHHHQPTLNFGSQLASSPSTTVGASFLQIGQQVSPRAVSLTSSPSPSSSPLTSASSFPSSFTSSSSPFSSTAALASSPKSSFPIFIGNSSPRASTSSSTHQPCGSGMLMSSLLSSMNIQSPSSTSTSSSSSSASGLNAFGTSFMHMAQSNQKFTSSAQQQQQQQVDEGSELNSNFSSSSSSQHEQMTSPSSPSSTSNHMLEGALMNCLHLPVVVRELLTSGQYSMSNGQFDIQVTMKNGSSQQHQQPLQHGGLGGDHSSTQAAAPQQAGSLPIATSSSSSSSSASAPLLFSSTPLVSSSPSSRSPVFLPFSAMSTGIAAE